MNILLGDIVEWTSSAGGVSKKKVGEVVEVIPAGSRPAPRSGLYADRIGSGRQTESYVVRVGATHYWPRVELLSVIRTNTAPSTTASQTAKIGASGTKSRRVTDIVKTAPENTAGEMVNIIGFALDMSGSMQSLLSAARKDFSTQIETIKKAAAETGQKTFVTVVGFGVKSALNAKNGVAVILPLTDVNQVTQNSVDYRAEGMTPMFDGVMAAVEEMQKTVSKQSDDISYLIMTITDGEENNSRIWDSYSFKKEISRLTSTDRWSFTFRCPFGYKSNLVRNGVSEGNIYEWETSIKGMEKSAVAQSAATTVFYSSRAAGQTSTKTFYANLNASDNTIKQNLADLSNRVRILPVTKDTDIRSFAEFHGENYQKGYGYYQLTKTEEVQDYKEIIIQDKIDGKVYGGTDSRNLLGVPHSGSIKLKPGNTGHYDVFVQSTSVNRKLIGGTKFVYRIS